MKKLFPFVAALAMCGASLMAAGNGPVEVSKVTKDINASVTKKKYTIATVVKVDGIAWFDRMRAGVKQFKADTGHDTWMVGPSQADAAAQVQIIENLIAQKVDAICVVPFSVEAVEPVLKKAREHGIVVIAHEASNLQNSDFTLEAFDNRAYGAKLMEVLGKSMGERVDRRRRRLPEEAFPRDAGSHQAPGDLGRRQHRLHQAEGDPHRLS
jgi:simple sugar transport system substrate-binding protein